MSRRTNQAIFFLSRIRNKQPTHHILDGQQRCYAIALGFHDPWHNGNDQAILWLDLMPGERLQNSTRQYLFRVTTKSHPWGFRHDNQSSRLSAESIRKSLEELEKEKRPSPKELSPFDAGLPVPVFLLFKHFNRDTRKLDWVTLLKRLSDLIPALTQKIHDSAIDREEIERGLEQAEQLKVIALQVPVGVEGIQNIEQIFQRLNRQGTPLDNEELTYSMIKAYWPDVEDCLECLDRLRHTTEPRLISIAIRVALTGQDGKMHAELNVDRIRNIFRPRNSGVWKKEDIDDANKAITIKEYFQDKLKLALQWIDDHFLFHEKNRPYGLPAYLRSSLAWNSRDVFAWLMVVAKRHDYKPITNEQLLKKIIGLALSIHWFGSDKTKAVERLLLEKDLGSENVKLSNLKNDISESLIFSPIDKAELEEILSLNQDSNEKSLSVWKSFWNAIVEVNDHNEPRKDRDDRSKKYGQFMERLRNNRELLVYVQRSYFATEFGDFDPSNRLMWKGHNRPWDYDHILPLKKLDATGRGGNARNFHEACKVWQQSIGNLIAIDFTFNLISSVGI